MDISEDSFRDQSTIDGIFPNNNFNRYDNRELYLSVNESLYKANITKYDASETILANETVNIDATINFNDIDGTIVLPQGENSPIREAFNNISLDPLSITSIVPETPKSNNITENIQDSPFLSNNKENTVRPFTPLLFSESSSDNLLKDNSKLFLESDSSGIDSLLMQSFELSDTSDVSTIFNSVKKVNSVLTESQSNNIQCQKNLLKTTSVLKKLIFDSTIDEKTRFNISNADLNESIVKLQKTLDNVNLNNTDFRDVTNGNVSFNSTENEQLLKSMKDELEQLMHFIKVISENNAQLEQENNLIKNDKKKNISELQQMSSEFNKLKQDKNTVEMDLVKVNDANSELKQNCELMKQKLDTLNDDLASCKSSLTTADEVKSSLLIQIKESEIKFKSTEEKLLESKEEINKNYTALNTQFEEMKETLQHYQNELKSNQNRNSDILMNEHEPCQTKLIIKDEEISSLKSQLKQTKIDYEIDKEILLDSIKEINEKHSSLQTELEVIKDSLFQSQNQLKLSRDKNNDLLIYELEPCQAKLMIKDEEIYSLKSQLKQSEFDYKNEEEKLMKSIKEMHDKYSSLENELEVLKESLVLSQNQLKTSQDKNDKIIELKLINESLQNEIDELKIHNDELVKQNNELNENKKVIIEKSNEYKSKLEILKNENLLLSKEIDEFKHSFSKVLNLNDDISIGQILIKFEKQFYEFTLLDELLKNEKINSNRFKTENVMLKEQIDSISYDSAILEQKLNHSNEELIKGKEELSEIKLKYDRIENLNQELFIKNGSIESEFKNYKEKCQHFMNDLQHFFDIPLNSFEDVIDILKKLCTEIDEIIKNFAPMKRDFNEMQNSIEKKENISSVDLIFDRLTDKFTAFKINKELSVSLKNKESLKDNLYLCLNQCVSLLKNNVSFMKIYFKEIDKSRNSSDCAKKNNPSLNGEPSSELKAVQNPISPARDACSYCKHKQKKMDEITEPLVDKVDQVSSLESVVDYWKARYYNKSDNLDSLSDKFNDMRKRLGIIEKENSTMKELIKENTKTEEKISVAVQCQETPTPAPPPNFVQICKINELRRKVEKLSKINLSLKEQSSMKDKKIHSLTTEISNISKTSSCSQ